MLALLKCLVSFNLVEAQITVGWDKAGLGPWTLIHDIMISLFCLTLFNRVSSGRVWQCTFLKRWYDTDLCHAIIQTDHVDISSFHTGQVCITVSDLFNPLKLLLFEKGTSLFLFWIITRSTRTNKHTESCGLIIHREMISQIYSRGIKICWAGKQRLDSLLLIPWTMLIISCFLFRLLSQVLSNARLFLENIIKWECTYTHKLTFM